MVARLSATEKLQQAEGRLQVVEQRVGLLEHRVGEVETSLSHEVQRAVSVDMELKEILIELKNKNPITDFVRDNWKVLAVWIAITSGTDVKLLIEALNLTRLVPGAGG